MDLLLLLVNFGYYVDKESLKGLVPPLRALINGRQDVVTEGTAGGRRESRAVIFKEV
jgi:hypothetical protein